MNDNDLGAGEGPWGCQVVPLSTLVEAAATLGDDLNRIERSNDWRVVDLRTAHAFRNGHLRGSIHHPGGWWSSFPYLLPPRHRPLCLLGTTATGAAIQARGFLARGWPRVGIAVAPPHELPGPSGTTGPADSVLWEPAAWLRDLVDHLPPGDLLDLACGSGRDAVYLGWRRRRVPGTVHGVDLLPDALVQARRVRDSARRAAQARGDSQPIAVRFHQADLASPRGMERWLPPARWSTIVVIRYLDREILGRIVDALRPGGHLVYQTFLEEQRRRRGTPRSDRHLLTPGELRTRFGMLDLLRYEEGEDEGGNVLASLWAVRSGLRRT